MARPVISRSRPSSVVRRLGRVVRLEDLEEACEQCGFASKFQQVRARLRRNNTGEEEKKKVHAMEALQSQSAELAEKNVAPLTPP